MANPYTLRPVTAPEYFVAARGGRGAQAQRLLANLCRADQMPDCVALVGDRRCGKTSLLRYLQQAAAGKPGLRAAAMNLLTLSPPTPEGFYGTLTRALTRAGALPPGRPIPDQVALDDYLYELEAAGERLVLFIDEFDLVARDQRFPREFFDPLRAAANERPLTLVLASVAPLAAIAHAGVYGSPFFNIFLTERLGPLSEAEAEALVCHPAGGQDGVGEAAEGVLNLAGCHPYFLQLACLCAWELRAAGGGRLDRDALHATFMARARDQYHSVWEHSSPDEQKALAELARGTPPSAGGLRGLVERGHVVDGRPPRLRGSGLSAFVRGHCLAGPTPRAEPRYAAPVLLHPLPTSPTAPELRLALVVAVNRYLHEEAGRYRLAPLRYAERDAEAVADFLGRSGFLVTRLTGERATVAGVRDAFAWLKGTTSADPHEKSCFVFHFSGHGQMDPAADDVAYLMLHDSDPRDPGATGLEMTHLVYHFLPQVRVPHTLVLLDACHAGFGAGVKDARPSGELSNVAQQLFSGLRGRMVLAACAGEAQAREEAALGHGIFTHYVLKHWRDLEEEHPPGRITFGSLVDYVGHVMPQHHPRVSLPVYNGIGVGGTFTLRLL
jgi:hypothetical protein